MRISPYKIPQATFGIFGMVVWALLMLLAWRLGMMSNGFSTAPWEALDFWTRGVLVLGVVVVSAIVTSAVSFLLASSGVRLMSSAEAVAKAWHLTLKAKSEYLSRFKEFGGRADVDMLLEDLPSLSSDVADREFLRTNADLQDADVLYQKALELEHQNESDRQPYNLGNAYNKLGYHYRFTRDWRKALQSLQKAVQFLDMAPPSREVQQEKATAFFHVGLVHMARYRELKDPADLDSARTFFNQSIELDHRLGQDSSNTSSFIQSL